MNVRKTLSVVVVLSLLLGGLGAAHAATTLPYAQSFEDSFPPDVHVTKSGSGNPVASEDAKLEGAGDQGLEIANAKVTLGVVGGTYDNVWIQVYMKPVKGDPDPEPNVTGQTGAFYIKSDGQLRARNGNDWVDLGSAGDFSEEKYYGFIVHANYATATYDIYSNNGTFKANMERLESLNSLPLAFILPDPPATPPTHIETVSIQSGELAYVDALAVSRAFQEPGLASSVAVYHHQASQAAEREFQLPAYSAAYALDDNNFINDILGNHILSGLVNGDSIRLWTTTGGAVYDWVDYRVTSGPLGEFTVIGGFTQTASTAEPVFTMSRLLINQADSRGDTFGFYPYMDNTVIALAGTIQPDTAIGSSETFYLSGEGNDPDLHQHSEGWTGLNFNESMPVANLPFNHPDNFDDNDDLYVSLPSAPNNWSWYRWSGTQWVKRTGPITGNVPPGANMWVKRQSPDHAEITVTY